MHTNPVVSMPDADAVARGPCRLPLRRRLRRDCRNRYRAAGPCPAARDRLGREGRHGHQFRAHDQPPARLPARTGTGARPTGGIWPRSRARMGCDARVRLGPAPPRSSANMPRCRAWPAALGSDFDISDLATVSDADYDALRPVHLAAEPAADAAGGSSATGGFTPPTAAAGSLPVTPAPAAAP